MNTGGLTITWSGEQAAGCRAPVGAMDFFIVGLDQMPDPNSYCDLFRVKAIHPVLGAAQVSLRIDSATFHGHPPRARKNAVLQEAERHFTDIYANLAKLARERGY